MNLKSLFAAGKMKIIAMSAVSLIAVSGAVYYFTAKQATSKGINPAFKSYISAFTGGVISRESPIQIKFVSEIAKPEEINQPVEKSLFDFSPGIKGTATWIDKSTIQFTPDEPLKPGTDFSASFEIGEVLQMPSDLQTFDFNFQTIPQTFDVTLEGLRTYDIHNLKTQKLQGTLITTDVADNEEVEKILNAVQEGRHLKITWNHTDKQTHEFSIDSIVRKETKGQVEISWDGTSIQSETKGSTSYEIPALGDFILVSAKPVQGEEQYLELQFSDPLLPDQDLTGLVTVSDVPDLRLVIDENIIKAYPPVRQIGLKTVTVHSGIKNINEKKFPKTQTLEINFEEIKPAVKLIGKGVILPSTDGLVFPFEAVSLRSVNVKILKIYENNVSQFFQVNNFDGTSELKRVGKIVLNKTISLQNTNPNDYARWKKYYLDLSELINAEPGAIYQVKIGFKKQNIYYACGSEEGSGSEAGLVQNDEENEDEYEQDESSYWDYSEDYYYSNNYNYQERENPCSDSYYGDYRSVSRNIFASDLGIVAKIGTSGNMLFAVTDLKTTQPISGATVEIYDFQQQILKSEKTNSDGLVTIELKRKPFFLIVRQDKQIGYLKLDNNTALPISNFDVSGVKVQKGIKGYLYGERGVWRPGDSLYLTFILEDKLKTLPENQPVSFELVNPLGQTAKRLVASSAVGGFYNFSTKTEDDDPTGNWLAKVKVGGADFSYPIRVETVMPNRLKIKVDFGTNRLSAVNSYLKGSLDVKWLHGAVARNLDADISMQLLKSETKFDKYADFTFDDPAKNYTSENMDVFKGSIDENGHANINYQIDAKGNAPGALTANFKVKVMEEGGAFSVDRFSIPYYPYESFTGIRLPKGDKSRNMLLTDTNHVVDIVSVDPNGKPLSRNIEVKVYKVNWRWWWDRSDDDLPAYLENEYKQPILTGNIRTVNGRGRYNLRVNYPEWGRYYVQATDKESGHSTGKVVYMDWPGWAGKSRERNQGSNTVLAFTADKEKYNVGEPVNISIPSSANGRALVSIESGSKVVESYWVETKDGQTNFSFKASDQMAPNVFINVTLLQPHAQTKNDLPIRMYGVIPIKVENPQTILKPVITMKDELRPEENVTVSVSEATGKAMTYTIAVVDEGLLDLTRFKTPDPWNNFYAREAIGVTTWDMYDHVIGAFGEKMDKLLAIGGDAEVKGSEKNKANRFKPVVIFMGPFRLNGGSATHTFKMPQYVGSVRTMVIAGDPSGAYGNAEKTTPVRKPLMILATLPRVVGPDEYVALPVNVFAMTNGVRNVNVQLKTNGMFEVMETSQKSISFAQPGDEVVNFYLKVKPSTGVGKVTVQASSGSEKANTEISIDVRNPNLPQTRVIETLLEPGKEWNADYQPFGIAGTNEGILEVSNIPPINLDARLKYLIHYPYGCIEQTTSSVFPQLYVRDFVQNEQMIKRAEQNIKAGIERLRYFQLPEGGLTYWPGYSDGVCDWGTNYAGHFMIEAEKKGFALPPGFLNQWKKYQKKTAKNWNGTDYYYSDLEQAYRLYTLALAKDPETGAMNRLRERRNLSLQAKWMLAAAYQLAGQSDAAKALINGLSTSVPQYKEMDMNFGSSLRDKAIILETMCLMNMRTQAVPVAKEISQALSSQSWLSTQEVAYCLLSMSRFANSTSIASKINFTYNINGGKSVNAVTDMKIAQVNMNVNTAAGNVKVKNNSAGTLYARVILTGTPSAGEEIPEENNLKMKVVYKTKDGKSINFKKLDQGTDFMVEVSLTNPSTRGSYKNVALRQIFASGWEIHNIRMDNMVEVPKAKKKTGNYYYDDEGNYVQEEVDEEGTETVDTEQETTASNLSIPTYRDIRDDRVYTFFDLRAGETKTFRIMLNAAYLGKFYLPGAFAEAMYDGTINAKSEGTWVEVVQAGSDEVSLK